MKLTPEHVTQLRSQFPALQRTVNGHSAVYLDGPAGTQVPSVVIDAIADYLKNCNANHGGRFLTSIESDAVLDEAHQAAADFLGADDPDTVFFGANMTTLTFAMSRALARTWSTDDEVIVTRLDHDANVTPWVLAAEDAGVKVHFVEIHREDCTLNMDDFRNKLSDRTKLVAVGCASNSVGTINAVREICAAAREVGALSFLDAVHYAPHALIDVNDFGCDFLACSAYKFFGPHIGIMWGRREHLESLTPYKLRPAPNDLPGRWMTGTQNHECIVGVTAAIDYIANIGRTVSSNATAPRREALQSAFAAISTYERELVTDLITRIQQMDAYTIYGITDPSRFADRLPTISIRHKTLTAKQLADRLNEHGYFAWHGNYYALQLTETLGFEPEGMLRLGLAHYNTVEEVDGVCQSLAALNSNGGG